MACGSIRMMRESKEFLLDQPQRDKQSVQSGNYTRLLVVLAYLTAIGLALFIGTIKKGNDVDLLVIFLMVVAALPLLRNGNALNRTAQTTYRPRRLRAVGPWRLRNHSTRKQLRQLIVPWNKRLSGWWNQVQN